MCDIKPCCEDEVINITYLKELADDIWKSECESGGDADSATERMIEAVADDLMSYIPLGYDKQARECVLLDILAGQIVKYWVKDFEGYEEQSHEETALQEAESDIKNETMRSL